MQNRLCGSITALFLGRAVSVLLDQPITEKFSPALWWALRRHDDVDRLSGAIGFPKGKDQPSGLYMVMDEVLPAKCDALAKHRRFDGAERIGEDEILFQPGNRDGMALQPFAPAKTGAVPFLEIEQRMPEEIRRLVDRPVLP